MLVVLAGGVGGSKFLWGLAQEVGPTGLTAIVNTGDDIELLGLRISPDLDIVTYTLAGLVHAEQGWGFAGDTFRCLEALGGFGVPTWFRLGDRDLATHLFRTQALREGRRLTEVAAAIAGALGVATPILPMSDDPVATHVLIQDGGLRSVHFQEYLVRRGGADEVRGVEYRGSPTARATAEVRRALSAAHAVVLAPSNPVASIGPILAIPALRELLQAIRVPILAVSPIVGGRSLKGPSDRFLRWAQVEVSPAGVAALYGSTLGRLDGLLVDRTDAGLQPRLEGMGIRVRAADTVMAGPGDKRRVARETLALLEEVRCAAPRS
ncbi:MAG: 2-phospho-L-lactate transferase [Candidatus Methylomirabilales bacterium]